MALSLSVEPRILCGAVTGGQARCTFTVEASDEPQITPYRIELPRCAVDSLDIAEVLGAAAVNGFGVLLAEYAETVTVSELELRQDGVRGIATVGCEVTLPLSAAGNLKLHFNLQVDARSVPIAHDEVVAALRRHGKDLIQITAAAVPVASDITPAMELPLVYAALLEASKAGFPMSGAQVP